MEKENIFVAEEKKNGKGKGEKYLDKENTFFVGKNIEQKLKRRHIFGEEKYFLAEEKKNGERGGGKYFCIGLDKRSRKKRKIFLHGNRKKRRRKRRNTFSFVEEKEKEGNIWRREILFC